MDSPFTSRLNSNYVPTDSESLEIQNFLKLPTSRLEELSIQLHKLDDQSTQLRNEHSSLLLFISKHRALISLIRKLPIEILQKIFVACLPTAHNAVMSRWEPPILLTQVCSSWRNVAHATPQLWNTIHIAVPCNKSGRYSTEYPNPEEYIVRRRDAVIEWLSRSATYPLDISLSHWGTSALERFYDKIIDILIRFSERWRDVRFSAPYLALAPVVTLPPSKVPLLETLSFDFFPQVSVHPVYLTRLDQSDWMTSGVLKAPKLRELLLRGLWLAHLTDVTRLLVNWSQLTNISIEGTSWGASSQSLTVLKAYNLLSLCRNLITCRLEIGSITAQAGELETTTHLISLPFLIKLSIREESTSLSRLFTLLHLPSLNCIEFHTTIRPTPQSTTSLLSLLAPIHNAVELITDTQFFTRQDFINCLRLCPLLKSLSIQETNATYRAPSIPGFRVDDAFLKLFIESSNEEGYLCPLLEDFECSSLDTAFSETALLRFLKVKNGDRITGLAKLKYLSVAFPFRPLCDIHQGLKPYKHAGLVATITYPPIAPYSAFGGLPGYMPPD